MRTNITFALLIASASIIGVSCKKSSSSSSSPTTTTQPVTNSSSSSFSINGVSQGNITLIKGASSGSYEFVAAGSPWTMGVFFSGTVTPASGSYAIEDSTNTIPPGRCFLDAAGPNNAGGNVHSGTVTVSSGASSTINFTNLVVLQPSFQTTVVTTYTLSGTIKY